MDGSIWNMQTLFRFEILMNVLWVFDDQVSLGDLNLILVEECLLASFILLLEDTLISSPKAFWLPATTAQARS